MSDARYLRTCRTCWTGRPVREFNHPYGGYHCDSCQHNKALAALYRIWAASFKESI